MLTAGDEFDVYMQEFLQWVQVAGGQVSDPGSGGRA